MDQDGSNKQTLFPAEGSTGIEPQEIVWSPNFSADNQYLGLIYQSNLWILDLQTGDANQITGDNSIQVIDWK